MIARFGSGPTLWFHQDVKGDVIALTDDGGNVAERYRYDAYGKPYVTDGAGNARAGNKSAFGNRILHKGRDWLGEVGLYDYRARAYAPALGRFLQPDPAGFKVNPNANLYAYCGNDPINLLDPSGLLTMDSIIKPDKTTGGFTSDRLYITDTFPSFGGGNLGNPFQGTGLVGRDNSGNQGGNGGLRGGGNNGGSGVASPSNATGSTADPNASVESSAGPPEVLVITEELPKPPSPAPQMPPTPKPQFWSWFKVLGPAGFPIDFARGMSISLEMFNAKGNTLDAQLHVSWMFRLGSEVGLGTAAFFSLGHEIEPLIFRPDHQSWNDIRMDFNNNSEAIDSMLFNRPINPGNIIWEPGRRRGEW